MVLAKGLGFGNVFWSDAESVRGEFRGVSYLGYFAQILDHQVFAILEDLRTWSFFTPGRWHLFSLEVPQELRESERGAPQRFSTSTPSSLRMELLRGFALRPEMFPTESALAQERGSVEWSH